MSKITALDSAILRNMSVELVPSANWRERAKKNEAAMFYSVTGDIRAGDDCVRVTFSVDAVRDGALAALGVEKPAADGTRYRLMANRGDKGHEARVASDPDAGGRLVPRLDAAGKPVFLEPEIITEAGFAFDMALGCKYLVNTDRSKTLLIRGVQLRYEAETRGGNPCAHASVERVEVTDAPRVQPLGGAFTLGGVSALPTAQSAERRQGTPEAPARLAL